MNESCTDGNDIDVDDRRVSRIIDKIQLLIKEWQEWPLQSVYAMVILEAITSEDRRCDFLTYR